jgi:hypothetical protein
MVNRILLGLLLGFALVPLTFPSYVPGKRLREADAPVGNLV